MSTRSSTPCTSTAPPSSASTLGGTLTVYHLDSSNYNNVFQADGNFARRLGNNEKRSTGGKIKIEFRLASSLFIHTLLHIHNTAHMGCVIFSEWYDKQHSDFNFKSVFCKVYPLTKKDRTKKCHSGKKTKPGMGAVQGGFG